MAVIKAAGLLVPSYWTSPERAIGKSDQPGWRKVGRCGDAQVAEMFFLGVGTGCLEQPHDTVRLLILDQPLTGDRPVVMS